MLLYISICSISQTSLCVKEIIQLRLQQNNFNHLQFMQLQTKRAAKRQTEINRNTSKENIVETTIIALWKNRAKLPGFMKKNLKDQKKQNNAEKDMKKSKLGQMFRSKIKDMRKIMNCEICESQMKKEERKLFISNCEHRESFCESCLHHYAIYKIKIFEEVRCPREDCNALLDTNADFFKQLPADVQRAYRKLHQFYVAAEDPNVKLCPKENCEGLIRTTLQGVMVCDKCEAQFCAKCLLGKHQGECEKQELTFFEQQLHYRQCKKCKAVIEKNQGCNHMTCRCRYQFCYVCGADWSPPHYSEHDQNGQLIANPNPVQLNNNARICCDCGGCDDCCGQTMACILKAPLKLMLVLLFSLIILLILGCKDLIIVIFAGLISIFAGLFAFSFETLSELEGWQFVLGIVFLPLLMIFGVGVAFKEIFCDVVPPGCSETFKLLQEGCQEILQI